MTQFDTRDFQSEVTCSKPSPLTRITPLLTETRISEYIELFVG